MPDPFDALADAVAERLASRLAGRLGERIDPNAVAARVVAALEPRLTGGASVSELDRLSTWISPKEVAARLSVSERTVREYITRGDLPSRMFGSSRRVQVRALEDFAAG